MMLAPRDPCWNILGLPVFLLSLMIAIITRPDHNVGTYNNWQLNKETVSPKRRQGQCSNYIINWVWHPSNRLKMDLCYNCLATGNQTPPSIITSSKSWVNLKNRHYFTSNACRNYCLNVMSRYKHCLEHSTGSSVITDKISVLFTTSDFELQAEANIFVLFSCCDYEMMWTQH